MGNVQGRYLSTFKMATPLTGWTRGEQRSVIRFLWWCEVKVVA